MSKKIILTRQQLNEVLKEENTTTVQLNPTGNTVPALTNAVINNQPEITNASKYGDVNLHFSSQKLNGSNDTVPTQHVEVEKGQNVNQAIQQQVNPTVLSDGGDVEVSGDGISEKKTYSKRQIEEARLRKMREEGVVITKGQLIKEWEEKPNDDTNQWNEELEMYESEIKIKPENKGKFNATKKRTGKSTEELTHSKNPKTRKRANFAKMAKRNWKPLEK